MTQPNTLVPMMGSTPDLVPVVPSDTADIPGVVSALYVETDGVLCLVTNSGKVRTVKVGDFSTLRVGVRRVLVAGPDGATTTADGIHAFVAVPASAGVAVASSDIASQFGPGAGLEVGLERTPGGIAVWSHLGGSRYIRAGLDNNDPTPSQQ